MGFSPPGSRAGEIIPIQEPLIQDGPLVVILTRLGKLYEKQPPFGPRGLFLAHFSSPGG